MREDKSLVKQILVDTVTLLCRNGLSFQHDLSIQAVIGITIDNSDSLIIHIDKKVERGGVSASQSENDHEMSDSSDCVKSSESVTIPDNRKLSQTESTVTACSSKTNVENQASENKEGSCASSSYNSGPSNTDSVSETAFEQTLKSAKIVSEVGVQQTAHSAILTKIMSNSTEVSKNSCNSSIKSFVPSVIEVPASQPMESSNDGECGDCDTGSDCPVDVRASIVSNTVDKNETQRGPSCSSMESNSNLIHGIKSKHGSVKINEIRRVQSCSSMESDQIEGIKSENNNDNHQTANESISCTATKSSSSIIVDSMENLAENIRKYSKNKQSNESGSKLRHCRNLSSSTTRPDCNDFTECHSANSATELSCETVGFINSTDTNHCERVIKCNSNSDVIKLEDDSDEDIKYVEYFSDSDNYEVNQWSGHDTSRNGEDLRNIVALSQTGRFGGHVVAFDNCYRKSNVDSEGSEFGRDLNHYPSAHRFSDHYTSPHASYHLSPSSSQCRQSSGGPAGEGLARYVCNYVGCDASFTHKQNLQRHQSLKHGRERTSRRSRRSTTMNYLMSLGGDNSAGVYFEDISPGSDCYVDNSNNSL